MKFKIGYKSRGWSKEWKGGKYGRWKERENTVEEMEEDRGR